MAGKTKPGIPVKGINIKLKMINDLMDVTGSAKDSWNPAEISDDMKAIAYIHDLADTWNPAQLNEALKYLGFATIDSWNPAIIEETKNKLVKYFLPTEASGNPVTFKTYGNLPYEVSKAEVTFLPKQSGTGEPAPDNVRPITGYTEITLTVSDAATDPTQTETHTETLGDTYYSGKVDFVSGKATIDKAIVTYVGNEGWYEHSSGRFYVNGIPSGIDISKKGQNDLFKCNTRSYIADQIGYGAYIFYGSAGLYCSKTDEEETLTDFTTALGVTNMQVTYPLATPVELDLTENEIELLKGQNVVTTNSNGVITLEYKALLNS